MSLESAQASLNNLNAKVESGDVEGGKEALSEMKVSKTWTYLFTMQNLNSNINTI